ncbi:DNA-directed RNA polymerase subunit beta, partial [Quillaja saponaria]
KKERKRKQMRGLQATEKSFILSSLSSYLLGKKNGRKFGTLAKKKELHDNSSSQQKPIFPLRLSKAILARSGIAVFGLGFIDAGYSGDWSRIGVISTETEDLLKIAAFLVVPLCIFLILSFPKEPNA